ncbi:hypothetical protein E2I00_018774, partial [Balaenoptera physalus]
DDYDKKTHFISNVYLDAPQSPLNGSTHPSNPDCEESGESSTSGSSEPEPPGHQLFCLEYEADSGDVTSVIVYQDDDPGRVSEEVSAHTPLEPPMREALKPASPWTAAGTGCHMEGGCPKSLSASPGCKMPGQLMVLAKYLKVAGSTPSSPPTSCPPPTPPPPWLPSLMTAWILLPVSLSAFSITGLWTVYAMAVMNHHVCPVENWSYNESCSPDPTEQGGPKTCCTLDDVPLISKCGTYPPESCLFSLIGNVGAFMVALICLLRYGQLLEQSRHSWDLAVAYLRIVLAAIAFVSLILSGVFFIHESSQLQHGAALCEWVFVIDILVFYGTFSYEFGAVSSETLVAALQPAPGRACKSSGSSSTSTHLNCAPESVAMI